MEQITPCLAWSESEPHKTSKSSPSSSIYSLQYLSRYLRIRMRSVFHQEGLIPESLLGKVEMATLKANLCGGCATWNRKLSELYRQLEKTELETVEHLRLIQGKLLKTDKDGKIGLFDKLAQHGSTSGLKEKLEIAEILRKETILKCSRKLSSVSPKVRVLNLTENNTLLRKKPKSSEDATNPETELNVLKLEINENEVGVTSEGEGENNSMDDFGEQITEAADHGTLEMEDYFEYDRITSSKTMQRNYARNPKTGKLKCDMCSKEFAGSFSVQRHIRNVHLNVRYMCKICNKVFTIKAHLKEHQKSIHLKQTFSCQFCSKSFSTTASRRNHIKSKKCTMIKNNNATFKQQDYYAHDEEDEDNGNIGMENEIKEECI